MITLFFSYAHVDEDLRNELEIHLTMLKRNGLVRAWHDRRITAGAQLHREISKHLEEADVILLLLSPHFLASDYCYDVEAKRALERHAEGSAVVIPVILQPCDWLESPFAQLRATPKDGRPVVKHPNLNDAFLEVTQDIRRAAEKLGKGGKDAAAPAPAPPAPHVPRSSNLRVKTLFSDHDRDSFVDSCFVYIEKYFEHSLKELCSRNPKFDHRLTHIARGNFTAALYHSGKKCSSCHIWLPGRQSFGGDIAFAASDAPSTNSINDSLSVGDDGYQLGLRPSGLGMRAPGSALLTMEGAAEYLWSTFVHPLQ